MICMIEGGRSHRVSIGDHEIDNVTEKILLVGEDNPLSCHPENALVHWPDGCAGHRLQKKIFGLPEEQYLAIWRTNLCIGGWQVKNARQAVADLVDHVNPWATIVLLGKKVSQAFSKAFSPHVPFTLCSSDCDDGKQGGISRISSKSIRSSGYRFNIVTLPHPSGRNTVWNLPGTIENARSLMRQVAPELAWGTV